MERLTISGRIWGRGRPGPQINVCCMPSRIIVVPLRFCFVWNDPMRLDVPSFISESGGPITMLQSAMCSLQPGSTTTLLTGRLIPHRYGRDFGSNYLVELVVGVTNMRVKRVRDRKVDQLADLAVVNERLAGGKEPWAARHRLEYLQQQRQQWEGVVEYLTRTDAAATMATIEEACQKVHN